MPEDRHWMSLALDEAEAAFGEGEVPVGCVVVHGGSVVGRGRNQMERLGDPFAHAELVALKRSLERIDRYALADSAVYVTLEPCVMCLGAMLAARIPKVVYGASEPRSGACGSVLSLHTDPALEHRIAVIGGIEEVRCAELMRRFFTERRSSDI